ncbi:DUF2164 domain-containing protein [Agrobacterium vitis]|uniref:DUF2164 domain-containing protein n=1 Tax=Agrobacterium vitis TaxID=373 RepID=UPI0015721420|nr:DUF2164 domain-containing protein [Agrobacterium vitis]NSZ17222.1 DUF2164 domain-containing protein [Agrobacterium vitis]QZO02943.1 DUF2164 domain-containing protein [Agrobacterium vitis]UJL88066.1 DUF2164 domain-containing protein [Agrobacterium vitis]BCH59100.1 hypothetical protein RvVAR0630_17240 [Agrobacterium vitis]
MPKPDDVKADFSKDELALLVSRLQKHLASEHEVELGRFEVESLIDFLAGTVGVHFYNRGLADAQTLLAEQIDRFNDGIYQLERTMAS